MQLDEYLSRLGLVQPLAPDIETLRRLHVAHLAAFAFHNIEIQHHRGVSIEVDTIARKFLSGLGGGYCFEQNTLFGAVLREIGFAVTTLLGRAGPPDRQPLNHMLLRVDVDGQPWLADVGFGAEGILEPLRLQEGIRERQGGIDYSISRDGVHWTLTMHCGGTSEDLFTFVDSPFSSSDVEMANYYISTYPTSIFRGTLTIQRLTSEERLILRPKVITRYRDGVRADTPIEVSQLRHFARELFGIDLGEGPLLFEEISETKGST